VGVDAVLVVALRQQQHVVVGDPTGQAGQASDRDHGQCSGGDVGDRV
jgi:hypothetical protein